MPQCALQTSLSNVADKKFTFQHTILYLPIPQGLNTHPISYRGSSSIERYMVHRRHVYSGQPASETLRRLVSLRRKKHRTSAAITDIRHNGHVTSSARAPTKKLI